VFGTGVGEIVIEEMKEMAPCYTTCYGW
jgi:hypothetical protein